MKHLRVVIYIILALLLSGCGAQAAPEPTPTRTPRPTRAPRATATPTPAPEPTIPPESRYYAGERLAGVVLDVSGTEAGTTTFLMQSFWQEAIFVAVSEADISDDMDGTYELKPGARVVVRFSQDVPDAPPYNTASDEVKIVDYVDESELAAIPVDLWNVASPSNGAAAQPSESSPEGSPSPAPEASPSPTPSPAPESNPYYAVLARVLEIDAQLYTGLKTIAVDASRTPMENTLPFQRRAEALCKDKGFEFLFGSDLELFALGVMNDDGYIDGGVYIVLSASDEGGDSFEITAQRLVKNQTHETAFTLENAGTEQAPKWTIS